MGDRIPGGSRHPAVPHGAPPPGSQHPVGPPPGMPLQPPLTSAAAASLNALTSAQQYAHSIQQYHAVSATMQALAGTSPMAAQAQAAQLLAQYQQSLAASSITPDMLLKQYPHLAAAGMSAPPHLLARSPASDHLHLMQAREREIAAERERRER